MHHCAYHSEMMPLTVRFIVVFLSLSFFCFNDGVCCLDHVEYEVGDCNVIITASHGGSLTPSDIPNRISGCWDAQDEECVYEGDSTCADDAKCGVKTFRDSNTKDLAEKIAAKYLELSGKTPHLIISNLKRSKLDANREIGEAAQGDPIAEAAYNQFHGFIQDARAAIAGAGQRGVLFDIHGHVHAHGYTELGYLLYKSKLIASNYDMPRSSVRKLASDWESQVSGQELIAGNSSLGEFMQNLGYDAVPSFTKPAPSRSTCVVTPL